MLGVYPRMSLATAREKANDWLRQADEGIDPSKRKRSSNMKVEAVCRQFVQLHAQARNKSWRESERILEREFIETFGQRDIREIKRSEEHTSELQSLMRISYAVFCLKKKKKHKTQQDKEVEEYHDHEIRRKHNI